MHSRIRLTLLVMLAVLAAACRDNRDETQTLEAAGGPVPLYDNLGSLHREVTTGVAEAQAYFDQGLRLFYAFNQTESARSFREAERLDPRCAMCAWGVAVALGPNINLPMDSAAAIAAHEALKRAVGRLRYASPREQAYIRALVERYRPVSLASERARLDSAYATAMRAVADSFPDDVDAQVIYADALMNLSPWYYWERDGTPRPATPEILRRLERALELDSSHPGACHLYIHAEEAHDPARAVACAERLAALMPGAGHLVHMPGHIYIRVGRYADAIEANRHAVHADEAYLEGPGVARRGLYPQGYYPHNYHFMSFAASMAGDSRTAIDAARRVAEKVGPEVAREIPWLEAVTPVVYWTLVTFGRWDEILAEPLPQAELRFATGQAYYARGVAYAAKAMWAEAGTALDSVAAIAANFAAGDNRKALEIAQHALAGEIALRRGDAAAAAGHFQAAVALEEALTYSEPPTWYYPMRQSLGKALLAAGRASEAERVYREDLRRFPENGWSLFGLAESLEAQAKTSEAQGVQQRFVTAWQGADVELVASRF